MADPLTIKSMTDLDLVRTCADAMGLRFLVKDGLTGRQFLVKKIGKSSYDYNPLTDDEDAMALVKKFKLNIAQLSTGDCQVFAQTVYGPYAVGSSKDLNRAICECVYEIQQAKERS